MDLKTLPRHPVTGLTALGMGKRGPIWPVIGGNGEGGDPPTGEDPPAGDPEDPPNDPPAKDDPKEEIDWKAMARKHEAQAKKNAKAAERLEKLERDKMDAEELAAKERDDARAEAAEAKAEAARERAARKYGLTDDDLGFLEGVPADKFDAKAKALAARLKKAAPPDSSGREAGGDRGKKKATTLDGAVASFYSTQ